MCSALFWLACTLLLGRRLGPCAVAAAAPGDAAGGPALKASYVQFADHQIHYRSTVGAPDGGPLVVLLHASRQDSGVWVQTGTLHALRGVNATAVAVDLPGTGRSTPLAYDDAALRSEAVHAVVQHFGGGVAPAAATVLVAPGSSGRFALPFMEWYGHTLAAWVPVGLDGARGWQGPGQDGSTVRLMSMSGQRDPDHQDVQLLWRMFHNSSGVLIPGAGALCYLDDPATFNQELSRFVASLASDRAAAAAA